ncbi:hypothetical protein LTS18_002444, partial [Coniosporium uncinatum]
SIGHEHVAEFAILCLCDAAHADAAEGGEKAEASAAREDMRGKKEANEQDEEVEIGQDFPAADEVWVTVCYDPEQE